VNLLVEHYRAMASYNAWANRRLHEVCRRLSDDALALPPISFFPAIQLTLDRPDYSVFAGKVCYPTMTEVCPAQRELDRQRVSVSNPLDAVEHERVVMLDRGADGMHREWVASVLPRLFMHQIHHRGQTATLAGSQEKAPQLDEFFLLADWPARDRERAMPTNSAQAATLRRRR
jgi:uncharacterized damage-inducible protein DinB